MSEFVVRFDSAENALDELHEVELALRSQEEEASGIRSSFRAGFTGGDRILKDLKAQIDALSNLRTGMQTFQDTMESILRLYLETEDRLAGNLENRHAGRMIGLTGEKEGDNPETPGYGTSTGDRVDETMKQDEKLGCLPGVSLAAGAVLGSAVTGTLEETGGKAADADSHSLLAGADTGEFGMPGAAAADLEDLSPALPGTDQEGIAWRNGMGSIDWKDFLSLLPEEAVRLLSSLSLAYLQEVFSIFKDVAMPFGEVWIPGADFIAYSAVWAPFFTFIVWYYYQSRYGENAPLKGVETQEGREGDYEEKYEEGSEEEFTENTDDQSGEDDSEYFREDSEKAAHGVNAFSKEKSRSVTTAELPEAAEAAGGTQAEGSDGARARSSKGSHGSGSHGSGGSSGSGGSGAGEYAGIGKGLASPSTDLPASETAGTADSLSDSIPAEDPTAEYLSTLLGEKEQVSRDLRKWAKDSMELWGSKAAEKLTESPVSTKSGPAKTVAASMVRAAIINAGIELAANGAGAVGSIAGGGKGDVFEELEEKRK